MRAILEYLKDSHIKQQTQKHSRGTNRPQERPGHTHAAALTASVGEPQLWATQHASPQSIPFSESKVLGRQGLTDVRLETGSWEQQ